MRYLDLHLRIARDGSLLTLLARVGPDTVTEHLELDLGRFAALTDDDLGGLTDLRAIGSSLFDAIMRGRVRDLYQRARGQVAGDAASALRIRLHFDPTGRDAARLTRVPWELMFDAKEGAGRFLALDPRTTIVRTLDTAVDVVPPPSEPLRRVLVVLASPRNLSELDLNRDASMLKKGFQQIGIEPVTLRHARRDSLLTALQDGDFQIVHVMCHGSFWPGEEEGALWLEDTDGNADPLPAHLFAELFLGIPTPRLVSLIACQSADPGRRLGARPFGSVAGALAGIGLPAVIAAQTAIADDSAQAFTSRFYEQLKRGTVEAALAAARMPMRVQRPDFGDWGIPLLFVRDQAEPHVSATPQDDAGAPPPRVRTGGIRDVIVNSGGGPVTVTQNNNTTHHTTHDTTNDSKRSTR